MQHQRAFPRQLKALRERLFLWRPFQVTVKVGARAQAIIDLLVAGHGESILSSS
jgi:hypothetical protein